MQMLQLYERYYDTFEDIPHLERNTFVALIKEARKYNEKYVKDNLEKKTHHGKAKSKKEDLVKDALVKT